MTTHLLTEPDCDAFRAGLISKFRASMSNAEHTALSEVIDLFDKHRSDSFLRRAAEDAGLAKALLKPTRARRSQLCTQSLQRSR